MSCGNCGASDRPGATFCHACGSAIHQAAPEPEPQFDTSFGFPGKGIFKIVIALVGIGLAKACADQILGRP